MVSNVVGVQGQSTHNTWFGLGAQIGLVWVWEVVDGYFVSELTLHQRVLVQHIAKTWKSKPHVSSCHTTMSPLYSPVRSDLIKYMQIRSDPISWILLSDLCRSCTFWLETLIEPSWIEVPIQAIILHTMEVYMYMYFTLLRWIKHGKIKWLYKNKCRNSTARDCTL